MGFALWFVSVSHMTRILQVTRHLSRHRLSSENYSCPTWAPKFWGICTTMLVRILILPGSDSSRCQSSVQIGDSCTQFEFGSHFYCKCLQVISWYYNTLACLPYWSRFRHSIETSVPRSYVKARRLDRDADPPLSRNRMIIGYVINEHVCGESGADLIISIRHLANVITLPRVIKPCHVISSMINIIWAWQETE